MPQSTIAQWLRGASSGSETTSTNTRAAPVLATNSADSFKIPLTSDNGSSLASVPTGLSTTITASKAPSTLPANVTIARCTEQYIAPFRRLTSLLLPIQYPDSFYKETLEDDVIASITRVALWTPSESLRDANSVVKSLPCEADSEVKVVAGIRCRLFASPPHEPSIHEPNIYISTIGTLAPFRQLSLASRLLEEIYRVAVNEYGITRVYAHVWEANEEALEWYTRRGFTVLLKEIGYYKRLAPQDDAWLIKRDIG